MTAPSMRDKIAAFQEESNKIEGLVGVSEYEIDALDGFLGLPIVYAMHLSRLVSVFQPGAELRNRSGMDVRVGRHHPPRGGSAIASKLSVLLHNVNSGGESPFHNHLAYETLHPFMDGNGRSGRALWAWQMLKQNIRPGIDLGFQHAFYYQVLQEWR